MIFDFNYPAVMGIGIISYPDFPFNLQAQNFTEQTEVLSANSSITTILQGSTSVDIIPLDDLC